MDLGLSCSTPQLPIQPATLPSSWARSVVEAAGALVFARQGANVPMFQPQWWGLPLLGIHVAKDTLCNDGDNSWVCGWVRPMFKLRHTFRWLVAQRALHAISDIAALRA